MQTKGIKLIAALAIAFCANSLSYAGSYKVGLNSNILASQGVFHISDPDNNQYAQVSGLRQTETFIYGEGPFSALNKHETKDETDVVGVDIKGHSNLSLDLLPSGDVLVSVDKLIDDVISGTPVNVATGYKVPARFTLGSWEDYQAGKDIELQFTKDGQTMATEAMVANDKKVLRMLKDQFGAQFSALGAEFTEIAVERVAVKGKTVIKGTSSRLEIIGAPTMSEMSFVIKGNF